MGARRRAPIDRTDHPVISSIRRFIASESAGGVVLALAAVIALIVSNSSLGPLYREFIGLRGELRIAGDWLVLSKPLLLWVNDLWMARCSPANSPRCGRPRCRPWRRSAG
jgi:hypothetical protein